MLSASAWATRLVESALGGRLGALFGLSYLAFVASPEVGRLAWLAFACGCDAVCLLVLHS